MMIKVFITLLVCGVVILAVFTREMWFPRFKSAVTTIPEVINSDQSAAELAEGRFPIKVEGGMGYQIHSMENALALLDDSRFHIYGSDGKVLYERQHTFANPILCAGSSKALIYDEGGKEFSLESKTKTVYSKTASDVIYLAALSKNDYAAVVTKSDKFLAMLQIFDSRGDVIFTYYSYDSRIIDVTFTGNGQGGLVTVLTAEGGQLMSRIIRFDFSDTEPKWTSEAIPALALDVSFDDNGDIIMIGDTMAAGFSSDGQLLSVYKFDDPITDYVISDKITAVITENSDIRKCQMITFEGADCNSPIVTELADSNGKVFIDGSDAYILRRGGVDVYNKNGQRIGEVTLEDDYDNLCKVGKYIFLLGYDSINRIDYAG